MLHRLRLRVLMPIQKHSDTHPHDIKLPSLLPYHPPPLGKSPTLVSHAMVKYEPLRGGTDTPMRMRHMEDSWWKNTLFQNLLELLWLKVSERKGPLQTGVNCEVILWLWLEAAN
ncbi:uncharacterized protein G2W53_034737 [Senna tora]|uniref:Uncharacterized protein n=1 Tax=Senna tora TaxID=362788 RepID=A0A834T1W1_9FABA|nr:uncharacterized protein G2W53_034737 [Senna tora]